MDSKGQFGLTYTEDFSVACVINHLKQEEVLQYFINRVSFYAFNGGEMEAVALWATHVVVDCRYAYQTEVLPAEDKKIQRLSIRYISLLSELDANPALTTVEKMKESFYLMKEWEDKMLPHADYPKTYELDRENFLILTFDFNLLCRMNGLSTQQVLQYFIEKVSLPIQRAKNLFGIIEKDAGMSLFGMMLMSRSMQKTKLPAQQYIYNFYSERLIDLDNRLKKEMSIDKRVSVYRAFYAEWYRTLKKSMR